MTTPSPSNQGHTWPRPCAAAWVMLAFALEVVVVDAPSTDWMVSRWRRSCSGLSPRSFPGLNFELVGFLKRRLIPRPIRFVRHPARFMAWSAVGKSRARSRRRSPFYTHDTCPVRHRTPEAAVKCRNR